MVALVLVLVLVLVWVLVRVAPAATAWRWQVEQHPKHQEQPLEHPHRLRWARTRTLTRMIVQQEERVPSKEKCKVEDTVLRTTVERGVADGAEIKFPRKSEQKPGQVPGDVVMTLKQKKHRTFTRDGNDLHMSLEVSLKEALLGFSKTYKHLDGHEFEVEKKGVTKPMSVKKIRGEGMPLHGTPSEFGDLHVKFTVVMPSTITPEQAKVIETLF